MQQVPDFVEGKYLLANADTLGDSRQISFIPIHNLFHKASIAGANDNGFIASMHNLVQFVLIDGNEQKADKGYSKANVSHDEDDG